MTFCTKGKNLNVRVFGSKTGVAIQISIVVVSVGTCMTILVAAQTPKMIQTKQQLQQHKQQPQWQQQLPVWAHPILTTSSVFFTSHGGTELTFVKGTQFCNSAKILPKRRVHYCCRGSVSDTPLTAELKTEASHLLRRDCPQPKITREEARALKELRDDQSRVILTAEKGVAMMVCWLNKTLSTRQRTYLEVRTPKDSPRGIPLLKIKTSSSKYPGLSRDMQVRQCYLQKILSHKCSPLNFMDSLKFTDSIPQSVCPAGMWSLMEWLQSWLNSSGHW